MRWVELAEVVGGDIDVTDASIEIFDVEHDSRRVRPGVLFACISGANVDGHDFAQQAVTAGASALLVERRLDLNVPQLVVDNVRAALGPLSAAIHGNPSETLHVVGVTGTNGKTTTVRLVASLLRALGETVEEIGTLTGERTTPEAPELQRQFANALARQVTTVVMEVSSHALDQRRVDGTRFRVAAFTNLGIDHLDHHGNLEQYEAAKARLFTPELSELAVVNTASDAGQRIASKGQIPTIALDDSIRSVAVCTATGSQFRWRDQTVALSLVGPFNVANAVLAAEIVVALGYEPELVAVALGQVERVPGRFETVDAGQAFAVIVDYAHTPDGLEAVLEAARVITTGSLVVVFGAGGDRDQGKRPLMGEVAERLADRVIVTSDNPRSEAPETICAAIVAGMQNPPERVEPNRRLAIRHAVRSACKGDVVVIAGKGHEATQETAGTVVAFDDRLVTAEELRDREDLAR
jgi:UDP-N-acetylmuramoyl-L-alanyl-D-glutamate--2,6-diaminopimelate ligase